MRERRGLYRVLVGKPERKDHLGHAGLDGSIILRWIFRKWDVGVWTGLLRIALGQDRDRWRALVTAVMNLRFLRNAGNFLTSCEPLNFSRRTVLHGVSKLLLILLTWS
jgi:hypothetical protein